MAKRSASKRDLVRGKNTTMYAKRDSEGKFKDIDTAGPSQKTDRARKANTRVPAGYGDQGDRRR
jgi:hypothetical protein